VDQRHCCARVWTNPISYWAGSLWTLWGFDV
jgi:hypothetical protein